MESNAHDASNSRESSSDESAFADRAHGSTNAAGATFSGDGSAMRERVGGLKNSIADALESGAGRLRRQASGEAQLAAATVTGGGADTIAAESRLTQTSNQLASGMQDTADWLRDADVDGVKTGIARQVKEHPGRTLAIAVGLGYLLGKAFRK